MKKARCKPMSVTFLRTGERRYAVRAALEGKPIVEMSPAPGYDPLMPHDLQHFIVERALGIEGGIYGQLAGGGTAGTFHVVAGRASARKASRETRKRKRKGGQFISSQRSDAARSERATYICWHDWLSHSGDPSLRTPALKMKEAVRSMLVAMPPNERAVYTSEKMAEIRSQFQRLSEHWSVLKIGEDLTEPW
jgi:hypothetical protein